MSKLDDIRDYGKGVHSRTVGAVERRKKSLDAMTESYKARQQAKVASWQEALSSGNLGDKLAAAVDILSTASSIIEGVTAIVNIALSFGTLFFLAMAQVLVNELKSSLDRQRGHIDKIIGLIGELDARVQSILAPFDDVYSVEILEKALEEVQGAADSINGAIDDAGKGGSAIRSYINGTLSLLEGARDRLGREVDKVQDMPSFGQLVELYDFLGVFLEAVPRHFADYQTEYTIAIGLKESIILLKNRIANTKDALDLEIVADWLDEEAGAISEDITIPLRKKIDEIKSSAGGKKAKILWADIVYYAKISKKHDRIAGYFDESFYAMLRLNDFGDDYENLVNTLGGQSYWGGSFIDGFRDNVVKATAPVNGETTIFRKRQVLTEFTRRNINGFNSYLRDIDDIKSILNDFGPYSHAFVSIFNKALKAFGVANPIKTFASGNLLSSLGVVGGGLGAAAPVASSAAATGTTAARELSIALAALTGVTVESGLVEKGLARARKNEVELESVEMREVKLEVENIELDSMETDKAILAEEEKNQEITEAQLNGEIPEEAFDIIKEMGQA